PGAYKKIPCPIAGMKWNVRTVLLSRSARGIPSELSRIVTRTDFRLAREIGLSRPAASVLFNGTHTFTTGEPPVPAWIRSALPLALLTAAVPAVRANDAWWSFKPIAKPAAPATDPRWGRNPIDAFVLAKLHDRGLSPAPEADRRTLIRRLTFDLIGLPPTLEEIDAFLKDTSPDA